MKNDIELTRSILISIRDREDLRPAPVFLKEYDELLLSRHVERLFDDGMIDGIQSRTLDSQASTIFVKDMTTSGHQFLASIERKDVWDKMKSVLSPSEIGSLSFAALADVAKEVGAALIKKKLGLN